MNSDQPTRHFLLKLIPSRPTFPADMSEEERSIMKEHGAYWRGLMERGVAIAFGPVLDPKGVWGLGIVEAENEGQVRAFSADDPAIKSGLNTLEVYEMRAVLRP